MHQNGWCQLWGLSRQSRHQTPRTSEALGLNDAIAWSGDTDLLFRYGARCSGESVS